MKKYLVEIYWVSDKGNPCGSRKEVTANSTDEAYEHLKTKVEAKKNWMKTNGGTCVLLTQQNTHP